MNNKMLSQTWANQQIPLKLALASSGADFHYCWFANSMQQECTQSDITKH